MQFSKRNTIALVAIGVLIGGGAVVSSQVRAQKATVANVQSQADVVTPADTDNIQDPNGVEQADTVTAAPDQKPDLETNDDQSNDPADAAQPGDPNDDGNDTASGN